MFEGEKVVLRQGIRLGNNGDEVDAGPEAFHYFNVQRF